MHTIGEAAAILGVSVKTLRHYDEIGLVKPSAVSDAGYRSYAAKAMRRLQAVLFYRELGFPLKEIAPLLEREGGELRRSLQMRKELLLLERTRLDGLIELVDTAMRGESMKKVKTTLADIKAAKREYAAEAQARWGSTEAYRSSAGKKRTPEQELVVAGEMDGLMEAFAARLGQDPASEQTQALVKQWQDFISRSHYPCSDEILKGLGEMYTADERFTKNIDRFGEGTAHLMSEAIRIYCAGK